LIPEVVFGIPAHPLLVHAVVVLLPLSAIGMIAMVLIPPFRGNVQKYFVAGTLVVATGSAYLAKESGQTLNMTTGVSEYHQEWGSRTFYAALVLVVLSAIWFWLDTKPKSVYKLITGVLVVLVSLAAITATVLAGHSGAQSVWEEAPSTPIDIASSATIALTEVAQHSTADDCWSVVNGNVYDLTQWINEHPGGSGSIESMCGVDASTAFNNQHNGQGKPETALESFQIGTLG
jgi:cytochrome b involved in lipid metabolism